MRIDIKTRAWWHGWLVVALLALAPAWAAPPGQCFTLDRLPAEQQAEASGLLLALLDSEALYTVVGGLKPFSSGFVTCSFEQAKPDLTRLTALRGQLAQVRCGEELEAGMLVFAQPQEGRRLAEGWVAHRPSLAAMLRRHAAFFGPLGITPNTPATEIVAVVDRLPRADRWRGFGYLYGYPDAAVDFFVEAGQQEQFVARDFVQVPTYSRREGGFVWAVPRGHQLTADEQALRDRAAAILAAYRPRRATPDIEQPLSVMRMLREWLTRDGDCTTVTPVPAAA